MSVKRKLGREISRNLDNLRDNLPAGLNESSNFLCFRGNPGYNGMLRNLRRMKLLFFLAQRTLTVSLVDNRRSISARNPAVGLTNGIKVVVESRVNPQDLLVSSITRTERNHIYLLRRVARVLKTELVRSVRAIVDF